MKKKTKHIYLKISSKKWSQVDNHVRRRKLQRRQSSDFIVAPSAGRLEQKPPLSFLVPPPPAAAHTHPLNLYIMHLYK